MIAAIDFGTGNALAIWSAEGKIEKKSLALPRIAGGKTPSHEFPMLLTALFERDYDVVVESPTIGSSGAEPKDVQAILAEYPHRKLYTLSARAVKNYRADFGLGWQKGGRYAKDGDAPVTIDLEEQEKVHDKDAEILYIIATTMPIRLRVYHRATPANRIHTAARPMDKRGYRDDRSDAFMALLPAETLLPADLRHVLTNNKGVYRRSLVMPFAMALTEPFWREQPEEEQRKAFMKILGAYDHGYPSFYRRMTVTWMQDVAKEMAGVSKMQEVSRETRKEAQRVTQRQLRTLFFLSKHAPDALVNAALMA